MAYALPHASGQRGAPAVSTATAELLPRPILDSHQQPTVEVVLQVDGVTTVGRAPSGRTRGGDEAIVVGVERALAGVREVLQPALRGAAADLRDHQALCALERRLIALAGPGCASLGANALLPVSIALWRAAAALHGLELYQYIRRFEPELAGTGRVRLLVGALNGAPHALRRGAAAALGHQRFGFMEMQVVPAPRPYREALAVAEQVDACVRELSLEASVPSADRTGHDVDLLVRAIRAAGYEPGRDAQIALDLAASHRWDARGRTYGVGGVRVSPGDFARRLVALVDRYPGLFAAVEDPLEENDWVGLARLAPRLKRRGVLVVGDDLYASRPARILRGLADRSADGLLVKPDQNGSLHGTFEVMKLSRRHGLKLVLSHRSGETEDDTIADVAAAVGAWGLKAGDPLTPTRRGKYLRMAAIDATSPC